MAKYEKVFQGNFNEVVQMCEKTILHKDKSVSLEGMSDWCEGKMKTAVRVFERYHYHHHIRVSLNLTIVGVGEQIYLSAITSGGKPVVFLKLDEESFFDTLVPMIEAYADNS